MTEKWNPEELALSHELADVLGKASTRRIQLEVLVWALAAWIADHAITGNREETAKLREKQLEAINKILREAVKFYSQRPGYEQ